MDAREWEFLVDFEKRMKERLNCMPGINRIRIVNFSYNNDSRHILDETFNFHGG